MMSEHRVDTGSEPSRAPGARDFIQQLEREVGGHRAIHHPYLRALASGELPDPVGALRDYAHQYYAYSINFQRYLTATISQLDSSEHRRALLANLLEEAHGVSPDEAELMRRHGIELEWVENVPHPVLYRRYLEALRMDEAWLRAHPFCDEAVQWSQLFLQCCSSLGAPVAVGAMGLGTELIVRRVYTPILEAIKTYMDVSPRDRVFFDLHQKIDDEHGEVLLRIAEELAEDPTKRALLRTGALMALNLRAGFYDSLLCRAREMPCVTRSGSSGFVDTTRNRDSLEPRPVEHALETLIHRQVGREGVAEAFSRSRGHPVYEVSLPSRSVSFSVGELAPGHATSNHRHAYESLIYVLEGSGWSIIEGQRVEWRAGDALYVPPWNWHQHVAGGEKALYLTGTNLPLLHQLGQTVLRQEQGPANH
ncbi:iron-containing redox enzyme family protein [Cystobacter ferrugineus]|uniref:Cupin n=1 Tax=Cystobacter ferrugineus TaxID=83449 RepID=A0A1L9BCD9_9BACT|nr:iron-containing redox enzyme family protein [Cystobacter ferrugineus]OJH39888.1 cupin [Cystobacter ferrugineus]